MCLLLWFFVQLFESLTNFKIWNCQLQVLVVRQDLKMGTGKIASQCARKIA